MRLSMQEYCDKQWEQTEAYIKGVEDGSIIACEDIKLAVKRFKEDINRPDINVRPEKVDKIYKFFSKIGQDHATV